MQTLRYTFLYAGTPEWDFTLEPATFDLWLEELIKVFQNNIENHHRFFSKIPETWPRYQEHLDTVNLVAWLEAQRESSVPVVEWDVARRDLSWCYIGDLVYPGKYDKVRCHACNQDYSAVEGSIEKWISGSHPLAMPGGKRLLCPCGHTLYVSLEWNS